MVYIKIPIQKIFICNLFQQVIQISTILYSLLRQRIQISFSLSFVSTIDTNKASYLYLLFQQAIKISTICIIC